MPVVELRFVVELHFRCNFHGKLLQIDILNKIKLFKIIHYSCSKQVTIHIYNIYIHVHTIYIYIHIHKVYT